MGVVTVLQAAPSAILSRTDWGVLGVRAMIVTLPP